MKRINVMVVPEWVQLPLKASGANLGALLDPEKILSILSPDDVGFYYKSILYFEEFCDRFIADTISTSKSRDVVYEAGRRSHGADFTQSITLKIDLELGVPKTPQEYLSFLAKHGANGCDVDSLDGMVLGFDVIGYEYEYYILQPKPVLRKDLYQCYESLISVMHNFMPLHEIVTMPFFKSFENYLNKGKAA